jgi:hypothetical protein
MQIVIVDSKNIHLESQFFREPQEGVFFFSFFFFQQILGSPKISLFSYCLERRFDQGNKVALINNSYPQSLDAKSLMGEKIIFFIMGQSKC